MSGNLGALLPVYALGTVVTIVLCAAVSIGASRLGSQRLSRFRVSGSYVWGALTALYIAEMVFLGARKAAALNHYADRATHLEILWRSTHGLGLTSPMSAKFFTGPGWFAAHFTPLIYVAYWPFFFLAPGQDTLTLLQTLYLASGAIPVFLYARHRLGSGCAPWLAAAVLLYPTVQYINLYGTAYLDLSIPLLGWTLYAFERRRDLLFVALVAACLCVREEMGLVVSALGLYAVLRGRRALGALTALGGIVYFLLAIKVIIPSFRTDNSLVYLANYKSWGATPIEIVANAAFHPIETVRHLVTLPRVGNAVMYLLPLAFMPLAAPEKLIIAAPNIATTFMSDSVTNYNFTLYYLSPTIPILFFAAIDGAERLAKWSRRAFESPAAAIFVAAACCQVFFGPSPISLQFWDPSWRVGLFKTTSYFRSQYEISPEAAAAVRVAALVPRGARISAEQHLLPLFYDRARMAVFPTLDSDIDYVMIDRAKKERAGWGETFEDFRERPEFYYARVENNPQWVVVARDGGAELLKRKERL